jgi:hypothetical protein
MRIDVRRILCAALSAALVGTTGCGKNNKDNGPAVATPSLTLSKDRVPIGSVVNLTYKFKVEPNAHFDKSYWVFMHVLDSEGEQMWTDDHVPPTPTTAWQPGQTIEYTRTVFVPNYPYIGEATARLGLYDRDTGQRLTLNGQDAGRHEYVVARFQVLPSSENLAILNKGGWYAAEVDTRNPGSEWQWTGKEAAIEFRNPKKNAVFYLEYDARSDQFTPPQQVTVSVEGKPVAQFPADARNATLKTIPISAADMGDSETVTLTISVDRTFKPGGGDPRELGIRVYHAFVDVK